MALFSRRACTSWRFVAVDGHRDHLPGDCSKCWVACKNVLTREQWTLGVRRCTDCAHSLVHCPTLQVRKALVEEPNVSDDVIAALVTDSYGPVSMKARRIAGERAEQNKPKSDLPYGAVALELPASPRRAHREQQRSLAPAPTNQQLVLAAPRPSVWDEN